LINLKLKKFQAISHLFCCSIYRLIKCSRSMTRSN